MQTPTETNTHMQWLHAIDYYLDRRTQPQLDHELMPMQEFQTIASQKPTDLRAVLGNVAVAVCNLIWHLISVQLLQQWGLLQLLI